MSDGESRLRHEGVARWDHAGSAGAPHTLVAFGNGGVVQEYDGDGSVVWQIDGNVGYPFRAQRIRSLYHPEIGLVR